MPTYKLSDVDLRSLLNKVSQHPSSKLESETIEFKMYSSENAIHNAKDLGEELSALANFKGGVIIVGVAPESAVPHGKWADQLQGIAAVDAVSLAERLRGKLKPAVSLHVSNRDLDGRNYLLIGIEHRRDTLVTTSSGKTYIRDGRSSRPMTPDEIQTAVKGLSNFDWTADMLDLPVLDSLDSTALEQAKQEFTSMRQLNTPPDTSSFLEAIGVTSNGSLVRGGLLFLGTARAIREHLGDIEYRFAWKTKSGDLLVNDVWYGCIWEAVTRAKHHFGKCNRTISLEHDGTTIIAPLLDDLAFHEAYVNALVHRDYSLDGMVSTVFTGEDLIITSPGAFYGGVNAQNIALHEPRHRNKLLARILMTYHLVDRAGMGVLRMGLGSLRYGRRFPEFQEGPDSVSVTMEAQFMKAGIAVQAIKHKDDYGIIELLVLNSVHEKGVAPVDDILGMAAKVSKEPWPALRGALKALGHVVELCGTATGIHVRVKPAWKTVMAVQKEFRPSKNSAKHVALYSYLKQHGAGSNRDLRSVLEYSYSSQVSTFLKNAKYVTRTGSGPSANWTLTAQAAA